MLLVRDSYLDIPGNMAGRGPSSSVDEPPQGDDPVVGIQWDHPWQGRLVAMVAPWGA